MKSQILVIAFLALTVTRALAGVTIEKDIPYKTGDTLTDYERTRCKVDLYLPDDAKDFAVVVWFHGGGLTGGDKNSAEALGKQLAEHHIALVAANYRLSPKVQYPAYVEDAAAAVAWVKANLPARGGDAKTLFIAGHSAGGYLAAMLGFDSRWLEAVGMKTTDIAGLIPVAPQVFTHMAIREERGIENPETTPVIDDAAPAYHIRKEAPPMRILLGDHDYPVRLEECQYFVAMLKHAGNTTSDLHVIPDRTHGSIGSKLADADDPGLKLMLEFIDQPDVVSRK